MNWYVLLAQPSWTFFIQVMTYEQAKALPFSPFDLTKVTEIIYIYMYIHVHTCRKGYPVHHSYPQIWPHADFPLIPVGKIVLNKNPANYLMDVEQAAFSPANMPPGIEASPDKMLQVSRNESHFYLIFILYILHFSFQHIHVPEALVI